MFLKSIGTYIPSNAIDNISQGNSFGETEEFIRKKIGATSLSQLEHGQDASDLAVLAFEDLLATSNIELDAVEAVVLVTQNGDGHNLPHTSAIVHQKMKMNKNS